MEHKALGVFEMVKKSPRSSYEQVDSLLQLLSLCASFSTADYDSVSFVVVLKQIASPLVVLHC